MPAGAGDAGGWLHLAAVIDLWSRRVVGWAMDTTVNAELVTDALVMAFQRRRPDQRVVHHSDRGAAYTSLAFSQRVVELEVDQSFGSTGDCYDNAAVESFFATLNANSPGSTPPRTGRPGPLCAPRCSTTSRHLTNRRCQAAAAVTLAGKAWLAS
jgi:transposase InsO family protein